MDGIRATCIFYDRGRVERVLWRAAGMRIDSLVAYDTRRERGMPQVHYAGAAGQPWRFKEEGNIQMNNSMTIPFRNYPVLVSS